MQNNRKNANLLGDLEQNQSESVGEDGGDLSAEELQLLNTRFSDALATLSKLKFRGKSRSRSRTLYQLPWYIIIGPPGAGKTTALVNSGLEFPLAEQLKKGALQGAGGTRNCDWWFTNEAVLIDTAGRYTTQDSHRIVDSNAWEGFLSLLKKNRRRRPINGVLVAISIRDLMVQSEQERRQHAKTIRARIDELMQKLAIRFPLYLIFTKADLMSGFSEFFEDLSKDDRGQAWGISLPDAADAAQSPDFDFFELEFDKLIRRLYTWQIPRMQQESDVNRRALIQGFPQQVETLGGILEDFVRQVFARNRFEYQPYLRGVYFTSGTQDDTPIDRMMSAVSANFGFDREQMQAQSGQGKGYFLSRLFREVIFPESELVGSSHRYELLTSWSRRLGYGLLGVVTIGLLGVWMGNLGRHGDFMLEVDSHIRQYQRETEKMPARNGDPREAVPALNALANASIVYDQEEHPWLTGLGLYDTDVDETANSAYRAQLKLLLLPRLVRYLENRIQQGHGGDLYLDFRVYLMFKKLEHFDHRLVSEWFEAEWEQKLKAEPDTRQALKQHLQNLLSLELDPSPLDEGLVDRTRLILLRVPVHQRIYSRIKTRDEFRRKVNLLDLFGESVSGTYRMDDSVRASLQIPVMFTRRGYKAIDFSPESEVISGIVADHWVLGGNEAKRVDFVRDDLELDEISKKVEALYMAEFIQHWNEVLKVLEVAGFKSIDHAAEVLTRFVHPVYSPLKTVLQVSADNTRLSPQLPAQITDGGDETAVTKLAGVLAAKLEITAVDKKFKPVYGLLDEGKNSPAPIEGIMAKLTQLKEYVDEITGAPDPDKKAFEIARARFQQGAGNAITSLGKYATGRPAPVSRWLHTISDQSWKVILSGARRHINSALKNQVYGFYREAIEGRYPLWVKSKNEVAQDDFSDFFKPKGKMDNFYKNFIKPFVRAGKGFSLKKVDRRSLGLSSKALSQIGKALAIKNVYFRNNPEAPGISMQLKPHRLKDKGVQFQMDVGDQRIEYKHGPRLWGDMVWSAQEETSRVRIVFKDLDYNITRQKLYEGPWAWLRLHDDSKISKTNQSSIYRVEYSVSEAGKKSQKYVMSFLIKAKSVNNPFNQNLLGSFRCPGKM